MPYACPTCGRRFRVRRDFERHAFHVHDNFATARGVNRQVSQRRTV